MITKETLAELSNASSLSGGTSLITLHIPSNYSMSLVLNKLNTELGTATNIKDKSVRKDVISGLKSGIESIKSYKKSLAPENGLVLISGVSNYYC